MRERVSTRRKEMRKCNREKGKRKSRKLPENKQEIDEEE